MFALARCTKVALLARVALVSKEAQDKAKTTVVEDHLPLGDLGAEFRGLPCEQEIALANVNKRKELEKTRKALKEIKDKDKEIVEPPRKSAKASGKRSVKNAGGRVKNASEKI